MWEGHGADHEAGDAAALTRPASTVEVRSMDVDGSRVRTETRQEPTLPGDISWRLAHALAMRSAEAKGGEFVSPVLGFESGIGDIFPSVGVFYRPVPLGESSTAFPGDRIVLLKVAITLTGMQVTDAVRLGWEGLFDSPLPESWVAPCVGAIVDLDLAWTDANVPPDECAQEPLRTDGLYVREIHPRRQEVVVNERLGKETLEKSSREVATTSSWNASVGGSVEWNGLSASLGGGLDEQTTRRKQQERSHKRTRETEVHSPRHVLTAYHLGRPSTSFSIQPRPFEGEEWDLARGFRVVEGIQEFLVVANVPHRAKHLRVGIGLLAGFRGPSEQVIRMPEPPIPPKTTKYKPQHRRRGDHGPFDHYELDDEWEYTKPEEPSKWVTYAKDVESYLDGLETLRQFTPHIEAVIAAAGSAACVPLYSGDDPCKGDHEPNPCSDSLQPSITWRPRITPVVPRVRRVPLCPIRGVRDRLNHKEWAWRANLEAEQFRVALRGAQASLRESASSTGRVASEVPESPQVVATHETDRKDDMPAPSVAPSSQGTAVDSDVTASVGEGESKK